MADVDHELGAIRFIVVSFFFKQEPIFFRVALSQT